MQQYVDHSYNDYGMVDDDELRLIDENADLLPAPASSKVAIAREKLSGMRCTYGPSKKNLGGVAQPFPSKVRVSVAVLFLFSVDVAVTVLWFIFLLSWCHTFQLTNNLLHFICCVTCLNSTCTSTTSSAARLTRRIRFLRSYRLDAPRSCIPRQKAQVIRHPHLTPLLQTIEIH